MHPVTKRHYSELNQHQIQETFYHHQHPFSDPYFKQVPQAILRHKFISYLSFHEQSMLMSTISKAFNDLVNFAREEQDWKDHMLDCRDFEKRTTLTILSNKYFFLKDYLRWQASKKSNKSIDLLNNDPYIEILKKKIKFISRIIFVYSEVLHGRNVISTAHLSRALIGQTTQIQGISFSVDFNLLDDLLKIISGTCPKLKSIVILFGPYRFNEYYYEYNRHTGLAQLMQNYEGVNLLLNGLENKSDFLYIKKSMEQCILLDPNFNLNLGRMDGLSELDLDDQWCSILQRCSSTLTSFGTIFTVGYSPPKHKITDNFIYALSHCTQLTSIKLQDSNFESSIKDNAAAQHDNAIAQVLKNCTRLKTFYYKNNLSLGDAAFRNIISHPTLEDIIVSIVPTLQLIEDPALTNSLNASFSLKKIDLLILKDPEPTLERDFSSKKIIDNADTIVKLICKFCPNLEKFRIYNQVVNYGQEELQLKITHETLMALASLSHLTHLDLDFIQPLSPKNILAFATSSITELKFKLFKEVHIEDSALLEKFDLEATTLSNCKYYYYKIKKN